MLHAQAWAKVNLYLHVVGRRSDGYHLLDSLAVFPAIGDRLTVEAASDLSLTLEGRFGASLEAEPDNLVLRAARALAPRGARIVLEKNLPVASGIGGGSADAAAALRLLAALWSQDLGRLPAIAAGLGADIPVCLQARPARMQGVGEVLSDAPRLPSCGMVLVNPGHAVSTPDVFRARRGDFTPEALLPDAWADAASMARDLGQTRNDLEPAAIALCPSVAVVLAELRAESCCLLARMSGSGATCFGLFEDAAAARDAAGRLAGRDVARGWWVWGGGLVEDPALPEAPASP